MQSHVDALSSFLDEFFNSRPDRRKEMMPHVQYICEQITFNKDYPYLSEQCTKLLAACRQMSRLRQPPTYSESQQKSFAIGNMSMIQKLMSE
jgi:hypothetical protein